MSVRRKILSNMEGRVNPINEMCVLAGLGNTEGYEELNSMLSDGLVEATCTMGLPLYRLTYRGHDLVRNTVQLVVNNTQATG